MKIVMVADSYLPVVSGTAIIVHAHALELAKKGHQVHLIAMGNSIKETFETVFKNFYLYRIVSLPNPLRLDHHIPFISPFKMNSYLRNISPDIVHIQGPGLLGNWAKLLAQKKGIKIVMSCYGVPAYATSFLDFFPRSINNILEKMLWRYYRWFFNASTTHVLSNFMKKQLISHGIKTEINVIPMWVDNNQTSSMSLEKLLKKFNIPRNKTVLLFLGRLDKDKNLETLLNALSILTDKKDKHLRDKIYLIIAGKGKSESHLKKIVKKNQLENFVRFTGVIDHEHVDEIYKISNIFIMPGPFETQSIASVQAISYGLTAVVANSGALPEIASRFPKYCFVYDTYDHRDLAEKIRKVFNNPPRKLHFPGKFDNYYSKESCINNLLNMYYKMLSKN